MSENRLKQEEIIRYFLSKFTQIKHFFKPPACCQILLWTQRTFGKTLADVQTVSTRSFCSRLQPLTDRAIGWSARCFSQLRVKRPPEGGKKTRSWGETVWKRGRRWRRRTQRCSWRREREERVHFITEEPEWAAPPVATRLQINWLGWTAQSAHMFA